MARDQVAEVKTKTDIVAIIGEHIELKKAGRNFKANCPFHGEKTPSFIVSPELQIYKCFGCGESGDVYEFLQKFDGMDFYEALTTLAKRAGVRLIARDNLGGEKQALFSTTAVVAKLYHYLLTKHSSGKRALDYLVNERGLPLSAINEFGLGFAPEGNFWQKALVAKKRATVADLVKVGVLYKSGSTTFDRFRGRVIFPLTDHRGNVVGFAGRILPGARKDLAKYINSPETPIYHKSNLLYGANVTKSEIKKAKFAVIVEGELDMISAYVAGVKNVVAIKGSAVTAEQAGFLSRICERVVLALDSDAAGSEATLRGMVECDKVGLEVAVADLWDFKDPDDMARRAPTELRRAILEAIPLWDFVIGATIKKFGLASGAAKAKVSKALTPVLKSIDDKIVQSHYIRLVADKLKVSEEAVGEEVTRSKSRFLPEKEGYTAKASIQDNKSVALEKRLLALSFVYDPKFLDENVLQLLLTPLHQKIAATFTKEFKGADNFNPAAFSENLPAELRDGFAEIFLDEVPQTKQQALKELQEVAKQLRRLRLKAKLAVLTQQTHELEGKSDSEGLKATQEEFAKLTKELNELAKNES